MSQPSRVDTIPDSKAQLASQKLLDLPKIHIPHVSSLNTPNASPYLPTTSRMNPIRTTLTCFHTILRPAPSTVECAINLIPPPTDL
jgi:hypothetical protein